MTAAARSTTFSLHIFSEITGYPVAAPYVTENEPSPSNNPASQWISHSALQSPGSIIGQGLTADDGAYFETRPRFVDFHHDW
jgi:hypothetical protein